MDIEEEPRVVTETRPPVARGLGLWWAAAVLLVLALVLATQRLLWGSVLLAVTLGLAAALRLALPEDRVGGLVVRTRAVDATMLLLLAGAVLLSALTLDLTPR